MSIHEELFTTLVKNGTSDSGMPRKYRVRVFVNPTPGELNAILGEATNDGVGGLIDLDTNDVYIWNRHFVDHDDMARRLSISNYLPFYQSADTLPVLAMFSARNVDVDKADDIFAENENIMNMLNREPAVSSAYVEGIMNSFESRLDAALFERDDKGHLLSWRCPKCGFINKGRSKSCQVHNSVRGIIRRCSGRKKEAVRS